MHVQFLIKTPLPYLASYLTVLDHKSVEVCSVSLLQCDIQMQDVAVIHSLSIIFRAPKYQRSSRGRCYRL